MEGFVQFLENLNTVVEHIAKNVFVIFLLIVFFWHMIQFLRESEPDRWQEVFRIIILTSVYTAFYSIVSYAVLKIIAIAIFWLDRLAEWSMPQTATTGEEI